MSEEYFCNQCGRFWTDPGHRADPMCKMEKAFKETCAELEKARASSASQDKVVEGLRNSLDDIRIAAEYGAAHPNTLRTIHSYALAALARLTPGKEGR